MADGREPRLFSTRSLYQLCVSAVVDRFRTYKPYLVDLPKSVRFDLYYQVKGTSSYTVVGAAATRDGGDGEMIPSIESTARNDSRALVSAFCVSPRRGTETASSRTLRVPDNGDARSPALASPSRERRAEVPTSTARRVRDAFSAVVPPGDRSTPLDAVSVSRALNGNA